MQGYSIHRLSSGNIKHLVRLYQQVFNKRISQAFLLKKYNTENFTAQFIGYIAYAGKDAVAFYGVIPCFLLLHGEKILAAQSADTMTHPDHRKKGLFFTLAYQTYTLARQENIKLIFGFPNQNSLPGFQKLNWEFTDDHMQRFVLKIKAVPWSKVFFRSTFFKKVYYQYAGFILPHKNSLLEIFHDTHNGVLHDELFLNYKQYNKTFFTKVDNVGLWVKPYGNLQIGFADIREKTNLDLFFEKLKQSAAALGCNQVIFMTSKNSSLYRHLIRKVEPMNSFPIGFLNLGEKEFHFNAISFEYCDIDIF